MPRIPRKETYYTRKSDVPLVPGQGLKFRAGRGYYPGSQGLVAPPPVDPLAPLTEAQIRARATSDVRSQVDPLIAEISRSIGARTKAGMGAIGGYTNQLASQLGGYAQQAGNIYGQAQASQAGSDAALSQVLSGQGNELAGALSAKLDAAGLGKPVIDKTTGQVVQTGQGAAGALYGTGSASLSNLIAQGAGAQNYAAKLPGIARLGGLQQAGNLQLSQSHDLAEQTGKVRATVPGAVSDAIGGYRKDEFDKYLARQAGVSAAAKAQVTAATAADKSAQAWARLQQGGERLRLQAGNTSFNQSVANSKLQLSQKQYKIALAREARLSKPVAKKGKAAGGYTAAKKQELSQVALDTAGDDFDAGTKPVETLRDLIAAGVPFSLAIRAIQRYAKKEGADNYWAATLGWTK